MKTIITTITAIAVVLTAQAQTFNKVLGSSSTEEAKQVINTSDGGLLYVGYVSSNNGDILVVKTDVNGTVSWQKSYGTANDDNSTSVTQISSGNFIISGRTGVYPLLINITSSGTLVDMRIYADANPNTPKEFSCVAATSDGGYVATGGRDDDVLAADIMIFKFNSSHAVSWQKAYYQFGFTNQVATWIEQTSDGGYIVGGQTNEGNCLLMKLDGSGNLSWAKEYAIASAMEWVKNVQQLASGDYILSAQSTTGNTVIIKTTGAGALAWAKSYNTGNSGQVRENSFGDYFFSSTNAAVTRINTSGTVTWSKSLPGGTNMYGMVVASDGRIALSGRNNSFGSGGYDFYFFKTGNNGDNCADNAFTATASTLSCTANSVSIAVSGTSFSVSTVSGSETTTSFTEVSKCGCPVDAGPLTVNNQYKPCCTTPCTSVQIGTASSGYNYSWSPTTALSCTNCAQPNANPCSTTTYTLTVISGSGTCLAATDAITVIPTYQDCCAPKRLAGPGDDQAVSDDEWFELFPNPASGQFRINFHETLETVALVRVTDLQGRTVFEQCQVAGPFMDVDLSNESAGVYLVTVIFDDKVINKKLTIE